MTMPPEPQDTVPTRRGPQPIDTSSTFDPNAPMPVIGATGIEPAPHTALSPRRQAHPAPAGYRPESSLVAIFGDCRRTGSWHAAPSTTAYSLFGDVVLDLREARIDHPTLDITVYSMFGDLKVIVPPGWHVELRGIRIFGDTKDKTSGTPRPDAPTIILTGYGAFSDVTVKSLEIGEVEKKWWKRKQQ